MISIELVKARLRLIEVLKVRHFDQDIRNRFLVITAPAKPKRFCVDCGCRVVNINPKVVRCPFCYEKLNKKETNERDLPGSVYEGMFGHIKEVINSEYYDRPDSFE